MIKLSLRSVLCVLLKRGRVLVIALSPSNVRWQLKKSDCPLVTPRSYNTGKIGTRSVTFYYFLIDSYKQSVIYQHSHKHLRNPSDVSSV